ncbi:hypothetical protein [Hydrocarboniphaga effusa]|uniref:hypothetical protein n=1 Tax=Hydrocarboniphaga effusa TaxID=243629 RepID=UPI00398BBD66
MSAKVILPEVARTEIEVQENGDIWLIQASIGDQDQCIVIPRMFAHIIAEGILASIGPQN